MMTRRRAFMVVGLFLVLAFDLWLRGHAAGPGLRAITGWDLYLATSRESEPLDCDEAIYGYIGDRLAHGEVMYRDLTENKPPGGYWLYAAFMKLGGLNELTVRLMPVPFVLLNLILVWWLGLKLRRPSTALLAALIFAVVSTDPYLYGDGCQMEVPINLFSTAALAFLVAAWDRPGRALLIASGVCLGLAVLVKQVAVLHGLLFVAALWMRKTSGDRVLSVRLKDVLAITLGATVVIFVAAIILIVQGAGPQAFEDIFRYGKALATDTPAPPNSPSKWLRWFTGNADPEGMLPWPFGRTNYLVWWGTGSWPFWVAAMPGIGWLIWKKGNDAKRRLVAAWTLCAWVQVALPGLFWAHYYLLPVPGLAVVVAVFLGDMIDLARSSRSPGRWLCGVMAGLVTLALLGTARIQFNAYLRVPPEALVMVKGGPQWIAQRSLGREIKRRAVVWNCPTLFVWGWQGTLYFYSDLAHSTPQVFVDDLMKTFAATDHPQIRPRVERIMRDLRSHPPSLMYVAYPPFPALKAFLDERYYPSRLALGLWVDREKFGEFEAR